MSQTGYQKLQFCLKQGRKISDICLKHGEGMKGTQGFIEYPPPPGPEVVSSIATEVKIIFSFPRVVP